MQAQIMGWISASICPIGQGLLCSAQNDQLLLEWPH